MPAYNDPKRAKNKSERTKALMESASNNVSNYWSGRSWTEVGYSVLGSAVGVARWVAGYGVKIVINTYGDLISGPIADVSKLCGAYAGIDPSKAVCDAIWPLIEDKLKEGYESGVYALYGGAHDLVNPEFNGRITAALNTKMKDQSPKEEAEKLQNTMSELCIRVASLEKRLTNPTITYCDDAYYLALDYFKMEAHRADAYGCIEKLKNDLDALKTMLDGVNTKKIKKSIEGFVGQVVDSDSVPHNNHYRLNLIAGAVSCSLQHCYGKSP